jgi:plastocyanin
MRYRLPLCSLLVLGAIGIVRAPAVGAGGGGCHEQTTGSGATVDMADFCYGPTVLHVERGATVRWTNRDPVEHVVIGTGWSLESALGPGEAGTHRFDDPGLYAYACYLHPAMNGVVVVGDANLDGTKATASPARSDAVPSTEGSGLAGALGATALGVVAGVAGTVGSRRLWSRLVREP